MVGPMRTEPSRQRQRSRAGRILWMLLVAALLVPPARAFRRGAPTLLEEPHWLALLGGAVAAAAALGMLAWRWRPRWLRDPWLAREVAITALLAVLLAQVSQLRANPFFTRDALYEGMLVLALLHLAGSVLGHRTHAAGALVEAATWLVGAHWLLAALGYREAGLLALMVAAALLTLVVLLRAALLFGAHLARVVVVALLPALPLVAAAHAPRPAAAACERARAAWSIRINLPAYRLDLLEDTAVVESYAIAIGTRKYRTPTGEFAIRRIVWNPWWIPPPSPWARRDTVTPPGPENPMGRVKLHLLDALYVHGSPAATSIGRAASHGCMRMHDADAVTLARRVQELGGLAMGDSLARALTDSAAPTWTVELPAPLPVRVVYEVAEVRGDSLLLHPDVYRRARGRVRPLAMQALAAARVDTSAIVTSRLARALSRARTAHVALPLDSLRAPRTARTVTLPAGSSHMGQLTRGRIR